MSRETPARGGPLAERGSRRGRALHSTNSPGIRQMQSGADDRELQALIVLPGGIGGRITSCAAKQLRIDPEFQSLIPPLSKDEKAALQASILEEGCRDPLVVWAEEKLLIDGHNRYAICTAHDIPYQIVEMSFDSRNAVKVWTIANQLGRRSLTPESVSYLRGTWYELTKQSHGGKRSASCQNGRLTDKRSTRVGKRVQSSPQDDLPGCQIYSSGRCPQFY